MKLYWPNAKTEDLEILSTYDNYLSINEAIKCFQAWEECGYRLKDKWVDEYENGIKIRKIKIK